MVFTNPLLERPAATATVLAQPVKRLHQPVLSVELIHFCLCSLLKKASHRNVLTLVQVATQLYQEDVRNVMILAQLAKEQLITA